MIQRTAAIHVVLFQQVVKVVHILQLRPIRFQCRPAKGGIGFALDRRSDLQLQHGPLLRCLMLLDQRLPGGPIGGINRVDLENRITAGGKNLDAQAITAIGLGFTHREAVLPVGQERAQIDRTQTQSHFAFCHHLEIFHPAFGFVHHLVVAGQGHHRANIFQRLHEFPHGHIQPHHPAGFLGQQQFHFADVQLFGRIANAQVRILLLQFGPGVTQFLQLILLYIDGLIHDGLPDQLAASTQRRVMYPDAPATL